MTATNTPLRPDAPENPGQPRASDPQTPAARARILLELLRNRGQEKGLSPLIEAASQVAGRLDAPPPDPDVLRQSARELLERIGRKQHPPLPRTPGPMDPTALRSTVAGLIDGRQLSKEHPAVIAIVIERQSHRMQAAVLRGLGAPLARDVRRALIRLGAPFT